MRKTIKANVQGAKDVKEVRVSINSPMLVGTVGKADFKWNPLKHDLPMVTIDKKAIDNDEIRGAISFYVKKALSMKGISFSEVVEYTKETEAAPEVAIGDSNSAYYIVKKNDIVKLFDNMVKCMEYISGGDNVQLWTFTDLESAKSFAKKQQQVSQPIVEENKINTEDVSIDMSFVKQLKEELKKEIKEELLIELKQNNISNSKTEITIENPIVEETTEKADDIIIAPNFSDEEDNNINKDNSLTSYDEKLKEIKSRLSNDDLGF